MLCKVAGCKGWPIVGCLALLMPSSKIEHSAIFPSDDRQIQKEGRSSSVSYSTTGTTGHEDQYDQALLIIIFDHVLTHTYTSSRMKTTG